LGRVQKVLGSLGPCDVDRSLKVGDRVRCIDERHISDAAEPMPFGLVPVFAGVLDLSERVRRQSDCAAPFLCA
jgi:hypothetical protein